MRVLSRSTLLGLLYNICITFVSISTYPAMYIYYQSHLTLRDLTFHYQLRSVTSLLIPWLHLPSRVARQYPRPSTRSIAIRSLAKDTVSLLYSVRVIRVQPPQITATCTVEFTASHQLGFLCVMVHCWYRLWGSHGRRPSALVVACIVRQCPCSRWMMWDSASS